MKTKLTTVILATILFTLTGCSTMQRIAQDLWDKCTK